MTIFEGIYSGETQRVYHIFQVYPNREPVSVKNLLVDGSPHFQTIGDAPEYVTVECAGGRGVMENVNDDAAEKILLTVYFLEEYVTGYIDEQPEWKETAFEYFSTTLKIYVVSSGDQ